MGRGMAFLGPLMAGVFGVLTGKTSAITSYVPPLTMRPSVHHPPSGTHKEKAHREQLDPDFVRQHPKQLAEDEQKAAEAQQNTAISRAIVDDFKEAGQQITGGRLRLGYPESHFWKQEQRREEMRDLEVAASIATGP